MNVRSPYAQPFVLAAALGLGIAVAACNRPAENNSSSSADRHDIGTTGNANASPITVTGYLQESTGIGGDYILTEQIRTSPVGTSGGGGASNKVAQEDTKSAERSYRLSGPSDDFKKLIGHQVRVSGTLVARSDLNAAPNSGSNVNADEIKERDLAKIDVTSADDVSNDCGARK
jgi:hypothetical protein